LTLKPFPRIIFLGTPEFAVASLDALFQAGYNIVAVITAPDKPAGRGMQLQQSAVKKYAIEKDISVLQPEKLKNPQFLEGLKSLQADVQVVVAFRMLPEVVWNMPPLGTINLHGSLLPQYRGAAPINWAIINGEKETGVTTFKLQHQIDTGNILLQDKIPISETDTAGTLHDTMKEVGARLLVETINGLVSRTIREQEQLEFGSQHQSGSHHSAGFLSSEHSDSPTSLKHAPKIFTEDCRINWQQNCDTIYNLIRGLSPFPGAFTDFKGKNLKIYFAEKEIIPPAETGSYHTDSKTFLKFACADGYIHATDIQPEGKRRMKVEEFLRGFRG
jgi:methionyl-tRNA formyltransferase